MMEMPSQKSKSEVEMMEEELARINRDIADYHMGEGTGSKMSAMDLAEMEARRAELEKALGKG
jgi:hypothetical protein